MQRPAIPSHLKTRTGPGSVAGIGKRSRKPGGTILMRLAFAPCEKAYDQISVIIPPGPRLKLLR